MSDVTIIMHLMAVWPLVAFVAVQTGALLVWIGSVKTEIKHLKETSSTSAKNGEKLANIEGQLEGISNAIAHIQNTMPKRRGA